jgi:ribosomal-protein-alanine N-acetyltransferase
MSPRQLADRPAPILPGLSLRPLEDEDAAEVLAHFADPRVVEFLDIDPLSSLDDALSTIGWAKTQRDAGRGVRWAIREAPGGRFVGTCGFNALIFDRGRRGEVAYDLSPAWWGRGIMSAVMPALIDFGLDTLALHRLEAMVTPGNGRSCRLLERHGFVFEGVLAGYGYWKGRYWDQIVYGLTRGSLDPTLKEDQTAGRSPRF